MTDRLSAANGPYGSGFSRDISRDDLGKHRG